MIELLSKQHKAGDETNSLLGKEQEELANLKIFVSSEEHTKNARYQDSMKPEEHRTLQALEAKVRELEGEE